MMPDTMPSERIQAEIDRLLDQISDSLAERDWQAALESAEAALGLDPQNEDAQALAEAARRGLEAAAGAPASAAGDIEGVRYPGAISPDGGISRQFGPGVLKHFQKRATIAINHANRPNTTPRGPAT